MSAAVDITSAAAPALDAYPDPDGTLEALIGVLMAPTDIVDAAARGSDTQTAWQAIRDPDTAPAEFLGWLAQHAGVELPPSADEAERRDRIRQAAGFYRGTAISMVTEVQRTLTGIRLVRVLEQVGGDQWALTVITRTSQTPDPDASEAAAMRQKPAGVVLTYLVSDAPFIDEGDETINTATGNIDTATIADVTV